MKDFGQTWNFRKNLKIFNNVLRLKISWNIKVFWNATAGICKKIDKKFQENAIDFQEIFKNFWEIPETKVKNFK